MTLHPYASPAFAGPAAERSARGTLRLLHHLARADFLERIRRTSFLITLGVTLYAAYMFLPSMDASYVTVRMGSHRGLYNSAWVGAAISMLATVFLSISGFFLVKNAVERDRSTGVGQILAATPLTKASYLLGKTLSNFAVLAMLVAVVAVAASAMQFIRGEDRHLDAVALFAPFLLLTLPTMLLVAGLAVFFECVPVLRGSLGNVVFFFVWASAIAIPGLRIESNSPIADPMGMGLLLPRMIDAAAAAFPDYAAHREQFSLGFGIQEGGWHLTTFAWSGIAWSAGFILPRIPWMLLGLALPLAGAIAFDRFDTTRVRSERPTKARRRRDHAAHVVEAPSPGAAPGFVRVVRAPARTTLAAPAARSFSFATLLRAELRLALQGRSKWWYAVALGLLVACALVPSAAARARLLGIAWLWALPMWSEMGSRESRYRTAELLFSAPRPASRQLPAAWLAGVILALATGAGAGVRALATGDIAAFAGWCAGAVFVPSMALALGAWSGGGRLFEVLFIVLWYMGPMSGAAPLDFTGLTPDALRAGAPLTFAALAVMLLAAAFAGRARAVRGR